MSPTAQVEEINEQMNRYKENDEEFEPLFICKNQKKKLKMKNLALRGGASESEIIILLFLIFFSNFVRKEEKN